MIADTQKNEVDYEALFIKIDYIKAAIRQICINTYIVIIFLFLKEF